MIHYFLVLAFIILICLLPIKNQRTALTLCLIPIFLFVVLQDNWTPDFQSYEESYLDAHDNWLLSYFSMNYEFGWALLCAIMPSYRLLIVFQMLLFVIALFIIFDNYIPKKYWILCFLLYWINSNMMIMSMSAMRSCFVMSLFVIAIHLRLAGRKLLPLFITIPLIFFHKSAIILLPFVLMGKNISNKSLKVFFSFMVFYIFLSFIHPGFLLNKVSAFFADKDELHNYAYYTTQSFSEGSNFLMKILIASCLVFLMSMELKFKKKYKEHEDFYFICAIFLFFLQGSGIPMVERFETYFGPFALVCYSRLLEYDKSNVSRLFVLYYVLINLYYLAVFVPQMGQWETLRVYHSIL